MVKKKRKVVKRKKKSVAVTSATEAETVEVAASADADTAEASAADENSVDEPSSTQDSKDDEPAETTTTEADGMSVIAEAQRIFEAGNYSAARVKLDNALKNNQSPEAQEQAHQMLNRMEMDVRTLMVGVVGMLTLLLIPTIGFLQALWTIPVLFLILLVDPRLFQAPEND